MVPAMPTSNNGEHIMGLPLREAREVFERDYLIAQISRFSGNISRTAEFVGMERSALHRKLKALGRRLTPRRSRAFMHLLRKIIDFRSFSGQYGVGCRVKRLA